MRKRPDGVTLGKITRTLGVDPMALSREPCAVANGPAEAVGREVSVGRKCAAEDSEGWVPIASLQGEEAKRVLLRDVCEALDGPELTLLLQIAGRMLSGKLALAAAEGRVGGDTERVNTGRGDDPTLSPTDESPG